MLVRGLIFFLDDRFRNEHAGVSIVYEHVSYEKSESSSPSNKTIYVRNIKDQIANMSSIECAGFKSEYQVGVSILILSLFDDLYAIVNASNCMIYKSLGSVNFIIDRIILGVSSIQVWNQENYKTRLKIDTPPFTRVCLLFFLNTTLFILILI